MKRVCIIVFLAVVAGSSFAQQKIGVVSEADILKVYPPAKNVEAGLKTLLQSWADTAALYEKAIRARSDGYQQKLQQMSQEEMKLSADTLRNMRSRLTQYNESKTHAKTGELFRQRSERYAPIYKIVNAAIAKVAEREQIDIVVNREGAGYVGKAVRDLTSEVVKELK